MKKITVKSWAVWSIKHKTVVGTLPLGMESLYKHMARTQIACAAIFEEKKLAAAYIDATIRKENRKKYSIVPCTVTYFVT